MPQRAGRRAPRGKASARPDPQRDSPPAPPRRPGAPLLLFPPGGGRTSLAQQDPRAIRQISCKHGCVAVAKAGGSVEVVCSAEDGAPRSPARRPRHIKLEKNTKVVLLDCEATHLLILSSEGKLSEHSIEAGEVKSKPRLLKELGGRQIIQIACGDNHSLALSNGGELFAWGQNEHGQLGLDTQARNPSNPGSKEPRLVQTLEGIPLAKIAAGSAHSLALSVFGTVFSWGKNAFGQLGLGDTEDRCFPTCVKALEHMNATFVACGGEHTAVLSKDGLVCTFGAGSHGQLGHNSTRNELFPRLVAELFGARVTQVACGRWHTLVYIPDLGDVYSFGSGAEGQLGEGDRCDRRIPLPLGLTLNGKNINQEGSAPTEVVKIIAGENQSIVLLLKEEKSYADLNRMLVRVEDEKVDKWLSNLNPQCCQNIEQHVKLVFSSAACINGSFQKISKKHFRPPWEVAEVDMSAVLLFCEKIFAKPKFFHVVMKALKKLLQSLPSSSVSPEALRVFLIVPIFLRRQDIQSDALLGQLARAIYKLPLEQKQILGYLWSNLEVTFFKDLVGMYRRLIGVRLSSPIELLRCSVIQNQEDNFYCSLQVMQMLYKVNCKTGFSIQESNFYVPELKKIVTPSSFQIGRIWTLLLELNLVFQILTQVPCIFDMDDKISTLELQANLSRQFTAGTNMISELHVRREHLIQDTLQCLRTAGANWLQHMLQVCFEGEPGIDEGGVGQEFFKILARELCAPEEKIFRHFEDSHLIWFSRQAPAEEDIYFLIGNLFGLAFYNMKIAAFPFPLALFKKMLNFQPTLEDLKELSPNLGRNLQEVLDEPFGDNIENLELDFTISGEDGVDTELKENGAAIFVTKYNRKEYVDACVNYLFNDSVKKQFEDFMRGFEKGCPIKHWKLFLPAELQVVLLGHTEYNWQQLEKNVKYKDYEESDETIKNFWAVFHDLPEKKKKEFLAFLTGTDCIPAKGMARFTFTIMDSRQEDPDLSYPNASTCYKILQLPRYTTRDILKKMLLHALENHETFGLS
ncbi:probable E3 ubiquitin-protein ligase HERC4 isoform X2 [Varanus komodoensis]|uniref:probable E3 ubiquitin-protein ligase HERC4 isoform X2 n=1 Tax=Varanus komodoensis TaxID=61221 RepID=UPI001CF7B823|nr:probable E3 ubiquitin-protein ligase HERC4 isoform X2 [Varanus komodoensis]